MYRVELKGSFWFSFLNTAYWFLMYRVELKVEQGTNGHTGRGVPNVPCGVESKAWAFSKNTFRARS